MLRSLYRSRQVWHAVRPRIAEEELSIVSDALSPGLQALFFRMERRDQRHALEVARRLLERGESDRDLIAAALLHDCGKGSAPVWLRIAKVLSPSLLGALAIEGGKGWRGAAHRLVHHAEIGARLATQSGASETTASLVRDHSPPADARLLALLTAADDAS